MTYLTRKLGKWLGDSLDVYKQSFERFSITLVMTILMVILSIVSVHSNDPEYYQNYWMVSALAMPFSAILKLFHERTGKLRKLTQLILTLLLMGSYYLVIPDIKLEVFWWRYVVLQLLLYALFFVMPYFPRKEGFSLALVERLGKFFLTALYAFVLYLGLNAIFLSVESLFELSFPSELSVDLFFCVFGFFGVPYFLGSLPPIEYQEKPEDFSKIFKMLFLYILIPIQTIYTLILYAYFIRLLVLQTMPEGLIGNLVLWYALVSFLTLFSVKDLRLQFPWVKRYIKGFSLAIIIPMVMFAIAMGIRIEQYGLTMARYFSIIAMIYLVIGYSLLPIQKKDTSIVLYTVAVCLLTVSFFGVLSWDQVVLREQTGRLETQLIDAGYTLNESDWVKPQAVSEDQQQGITNTLNYLVDHYEIEEIKILPKGFTTDTAEVYLGFELNLGHLLYNDKDYFNQNYRAQNEPIDVKGADYVLLLNRYGDLRHRLYDGRAILEKIETIGNASTTESKADIKIIMDGFLIGEVSMNALSRKAYEENEAYQSVEFSTTLGERFILEFDFIEIGGRKKKTGEFYSIDNYQCWLKISKK